MTEETVFQRLIGKSEEVQDLIDDLEDLDGDEDARWELALEFAMEDIPHIIEELETIDHDGG